MIEHEKLNEGYLRYEHLINLPFQHGVQDCYTIAQRMFLDNLNIKLSNFARPDDWWVSGMDLYNDNFRNEGFEIVDDAHIDAKSLRPLDCFLIALPDSRNPSAHVANHCAIYLGEGKIIHHRLGKNSQVIPYRYSMKDLTMATIRHRDVPDMSIQKSKQIDIMDHILPHKKELVMGVINERRD